MTREEMRAEYERALERAEALGLRVAADGYTAEGARVYFVPSSSNASVWHHITVDRDGFHCSCSQGTTGHGAHYCTHRAVARQAWLQEEHVLQQAEVRQHEPRDPRPSRVLQYDGRKRNGRCGACGVAFELGQDLVLWGEKAYHVDCVPTTETRDTGVLRNNNNKPFNMMK